MNNGVKGEKSTLLSAAYLHSTDINVLENMEPAPR